MWTVVQSRRKKGRRGRNPDPPAPQMRTQAQIERTKALRGNDTDDPVNFLSLPRELRDEIYLHANVVPPKTMRLCCKHRNLARGYCVVERRRYFRPLRSLLLVCRQVKAEVWEIFMKNTRFSIEPSGRMRHKLLERGSVAHWNRCPCAKIVKVVAAGVSIISRRPRFVKRPGQNEVVTISSARHSFGMRTEYGSVGYPSQSTTRP